jgi:VWFA-related protein
MSRTTELEKFFRIPGEEAGRLLVFVALVAFRAAAQGPPTDEPGLVLRFNVDLVQVDAVVTDSSGAHVSGLRVGDFEVLQDGKPRKITHFFCIGGGQPAPPPGTANPAREEVRQTVVLLLDDYHIDPGNFGLLRNAVLRLVNEEVQPGVLVSIVRTTGGSGALQQFTSDREFLRMAVERMLWRPPIASSHDLLIPELGRILRALGAFPGRKCVILISPGRSLTWLRGSMEFLKAIEHAANQASVTIQTIDVRGLASLALTAADNPDFGTLIGHPDRIMMKRSRDYLSSQDVLSTIASMTGGLFLHERNDLLDAMRDAVADSSGYYLLGWYPGEKVFEERPGPPDYHRIAIKVRRKGLRVRTRQGFYTGPPMIDQPGTIAPRRPVPGAEARETLLSPFSGGIDVRLTASPGYDEERGTYIESLLEVRPKGILFQSLSDGCQGASLEIISAAVPLSRGATPEDKLEDARKEILICDRAEEVLARGIVLEARRFVPPGAYQVRFAVRNAQPTEQRPGANSGSAAIGSASEVVEVPDPRKGEMAVSGLTLWQGREPVQPTSGMAIRAVADGDPAVRRFHAGEPIRYRYRVAGQKSAAQVRVRVLAGSDEIYNGLADGVYNPNPALAPGDYWFGVVAAGARSASAQQWMDFEVVR